MRRLLVLIVAVIVVVMLPVGNHTRADESPCAVVSVGAETIANGTLMNIGQNVIGIASNGSVTAHAGVMYCLAPTDRKGDCSSPAYVINLSDFNKLLDCLDISGPGGMYAGTDDGCVCADFDEDGDVDLTDFAEFVLVFGG